MFCCQHVYADNLIAPVFDGHSFLAEASDSLWKVSAKTGEAQISNIQSFGLPSMLAYGNGLYLGYVPMSSGLIKSSDGINWQKLTPVITRNIPENPVDRQIQNLMFVKNMFYSILVNGAVCSSLDGVAWDCSGSLPKGRNPFQTMACGNHIAEITQTSNPTPSGIVTGDSVGFSPDGKTWVYSSVPFMVDKWSCAGSDVAGIRQEFGTNPVIVTFKADGKVIESKPINQIINSVGGMNDEILAFGNNSYPPYDIAGISTNEGKTFKFVRAKKTSSIFTITCEKKACVGQSAAGGLGLNYVLLYSKDAIHWSSVR